MDNTQESDRLQDLYLTGVRPNGKDIGVGAYGRVFEVEYCGTIFAAKEVHSILVQGEEFEATKKAFLTECIRRGCLAHPNVVLFLGVYNPGGQSLLPVLVMEFHLKDAGEPYISGGKVPKYSDVREVVYVIGCVSRIVVPSHSSSSHRSSRPLTKQCIVDSLIILPSFIETSHQTMYC